MCNFNVTSQSTETRNSANVKFFIFNNRKEYVVDYTNISNVGEIVEVLKKDFYLYYDINGVRGRIDLDKNLNSGNYMLMNKGEVVCEFNFNRMAGTNVNRVVGAVMSEIERIVESAKQQVVEQENEQEQDIDIEYLVNEFNENMKSNVANDFENTIQDIAEYGGGEYDTESEHICGGFNYEINYEHEWVEFYVNETGDSYDNAYNVFRENWEFLINEDTMEDYVDSLGNMYGVGIEDNSWGECLLWVKNPYYNAPKNDTPCLDIDSLVGENISDMLVYDDGVYVTVDYDKTFDKSNVLNTLRREYALCDVDEYEMPINTLADRCGGYHVGLSDTSSIYVMYNKESDSYYVNGLGEYDDYAINERLTSKTSYMELYDMITECIENNVNELKWVNETFFKSEIIANALDEAMESDDEYYDDAICQIGKWYVNYTSPCDEFPSGCVCVVNAKGVNMGGTWCSVADFDTAVEYLVGMIEICNKEFNKVA